jgi:hypothetical protein
MFDVDFEVTERAEYAFLRAAAARGKLPAEFLEELMAGLAGFLRPRVTDEEVVRYHREKHPEHREADAAALIEAIYEAVLKIEGDEAADG